MILHTHTSLIRIETIRILLASGYELAQVADLFGRSKQAMYGAVDRFDLRNPLKPFSEADIERAPYLKVAMHPKVRNKLVDANIIQTLLGVEQ
jgi:hypothetical protein